MISKEFRWIEKSFYNKLNVNDDSKYKRSRTQCKALYSARHEKLNEEIVPALLSDDKTYKVVLKNQTFQTTVAIMPLLQL